MYTLMARTAQGAPMRDRWRGMRGQLIQNGREELFCCHGVCGYREISGRLKGKESGFFSVKSPSWLEMCAALAVVDKTVASFHPSSNSTNSVQPGGRCWDRAGFQTPKP